MKISVVIIAHNEEKYIKQCIESILNQSKKADEIILVAHNCSDKTIQIAGHYPIKIKDFKDEPGIVHARIEGISECNGDIILCIDGDSYAARNWIKTLSNEVASGAVLAGSYIKVTNSIFWAFANLFNKMIITIFKSPKGFLWGPSFAFKSKDKEFITNSLKQSEFLSKKLGLSRNPDDYWLELFMRTKGSVTITPATYVIQHPKESSFKEDIIRNRENVRNAKIVLNYFYENQL